MDEEDEVVAEIPVFLSQALSQNLYIYQYPVRAGAHDWDSTRVLNALVKPKNRQVRLEFELDTLSDKYCPSKGEQIALNTDGHQDSSRYVNNKEREKAQYFRTGTMDKMVYESVAPAVGCNYAVAVIQDKEMHCTPINGIVQMRPSYSYFDRQDKRASETRRADNSDDDEEEDAQQVTVTFARQETELAKKAREKSFEFMSRKSADEQWCDAVWRHADTDHADLERLKLFCPSASSGAALSLPASQYLPSLVPPPARDAGEGGAAGAAGAAAPADLRSLRGLPLADQCRALLKEAKLLSYGEVRSLVCAPSGAGGAGGAGGGGGGGEGAPAHAALLSALSGAACCVRGLWAARSVDLYTCTSAVPPAQLCRARDYVLYLFTQSPYVDRRKVAAAVRLPPDVVLSILETVARCNPRTGWELLLPPDTGFEADHPDVVQRQNLYWEARRRQLDEMLAAEPAAPKRQRKKSQRESIGSDALLSPKPRHNSTSHEEDGERRRKGKSAGGTGKRTRNLSVGNDAS